MIKFFRISRRALMETGKTTRYFKYAIGEIILVVIGILIALQINNWNENRKYALDKTQFLNGMKLELKLDIDRADTLIARYKERLSYFNMVDPSYNLHDLDIVPLPDSSNVLDYDKLMRRLMPFKPNNGTYQAFTTYGSTRVLKNNELLIDLQRYYSIIEDYNFNTYETMKNVEAQLNWNRAYEKKYKPYKTIESLNDKEFIAELSYFFDTMHSYLSLLFYVKNEADELINDIDQELIDSKNSL